MKGMPFVKMVAAGNDFVVMESRKLQATSYKLQAKRVCDRKYGVGADGLLLLEKSKIADCKMRVFNADGSEAEMCGNGARCVALYASRKQQDNDSARTIKIQTKAGIILSKVTGETVSIKLTDPSALKLGIPIKINNRILKVNFINTGVPHAVVFVAGLEKIDVLRLGRAIRFHKAFAPKGANVNFVQVESDDAIKVRTYERGVEGETLACGTGSVASALLSSVALHVNNGFKVSTSGKEVLRVSFDKTGLHFRNVWLKGKVRAVFCGEFAY